ncbi:2-oxo-4-hydroxy-4-carboxy-5-ureidoimidazoline decarboxylase [Roseomonas gilardii]|uniref:2-oxo-4-hydroxy-4-carboxy-5-ureidoimidazoline decarboxylase n=1 Tax=Roseomonas gilardii TaxID=257708 RepID=UPI001C92D63F|nr:2-oxo-4-hydroxy-4-carboxy-5-ureidoimidazoline decarboxylase [Roseomonas gilardii]
MEQSLTLAALNAATPADFAAALHGVFEHAPWVAPAVAARRPFASVEALHAAMLAEMRQAPEERRRAFLNGHPELSAGALAGDLTHDSAREQAGVSLADGLAAQAGEFEALNASYRRRFCIPFLLCVRRHTAANVLRVLRARLDGTPGGEEREALEEVGHVTRLRLARRITGPGAIVPGGELSVHVLDNALGRPAEGLRVTLRQEGRLVAEGVTDAQGRTPAPLLSDGPLRMGLYELGYEVGAYFAGRGIEGFYDTIPVRFMLREAEGHYHVPLLLSPFSYSTYRGH